MANPPDELINRVTWKVPNALALVGSASGEEWNGMTTSWITQVAMGPEVLIGVGVDKKAVTHRLIEEGGSFTVNLWDSEHTRPFVKFSKPAVRDGNTLNGLAVRLGETGAPIFEDAIAWMDCRVVNPVDCGSHTFFIGALVDCDIVDDEKRPAAMSDTRMKYGGVLRGGH